MKVCLYLELEDKFKVAGIGSAIKNQRRALDLNGVEHTSNPKDKFDIIHINTIGPKSLYHAKRAHLKGKKVVLHAHTTAEDFSDSFFLSTKLYHPLRKYLSFYYNCGDIVLVPSGYTKQILLSYGIKKPIKVISNGIEIEKFGNMGDKRNVYREKYGLRNTVVFSVGLVLPRKGIPTFIDTAEHFDNKFVWFGKIYRKLLSRKFIKLIDNPPGNVLFTNYVNDITAAYASGDIFFFPTRNENQGIVILEAMAAKKPMVLRDIPVFDWLTHEKNCLKSQNREGFVEQLQALMNDERLQKKLVQNAYRDVRDHSLEKVGGRLKGVYEEILSF
ncbi:MAG: hypothetical protein A7316_06580 [Candidatus Altiarchaeales archaeon WOR_SM1_86-2]|nr:MAG: hypothetical protein A7316_06580 [Candidatus Altiarchaeales archaeon WOR_SM1_86-2]